MSKAIIICGDRHWSNEKIIEDFVYLLPPDVRVISGGAPGADYLAERARKKYNLDGKVYKANWTMFGKAAGPIRNRRMIEDESPYLVVAFHNYISRSRGTRDMLLKAKKKGIRYQLRNSIGDVEYNPKL